MSKLLRAIQGVGPAKVVFIAPFRPTRNMFFIRYTSSEDAEVMLPAVINEDVYPLSDNYKITLVPMQEGFAKQHYYVGDLESLIRRGTVKFLIEAPFDKE